MLQTNCRVVVLTLMFIALGGAPWGDFQSFAQEKIPIVISLGIGAIA